LGLVLGVDGGNSKTEVVVARTDGAVLGSARGPGTNSHAIGAEAVADAIGRLVAEASLAGAADHGVFFLSGADIPADVAELEAVIAVGGWARRVHVDNDTFAVLRAGTERPDAVAVICGAGINVVGRASGGRIARYPSLGWETGDWGGSEMLGRDVVFHAARAEDGRGAPTVLVEVVKRHFRAASVEAVGTDVHYRRLPQARLGELAPLVLQSAAEGDDVANLLVDRLANEIVLLARRALADLGVGEADVVLGGGMLRDPSGVLFDRVTAALPSGASPVALDAPPVLGAVLAALDAVGADGDAKDRVREELGGR
jgi:N-acetylglucosamine kinase-like BadF-type ATPase